MLEAQKKSLVDVMPCLEFVLPEIMQLRNYAHAYDIIVSNNISAIWDILLSSGIEPCGNHIHNNRVYEGEYSTAYNRDILPMITMITNSSWTLRQIIFISSTVEVVSEHGLLAGSTQEVLSTA